MKIVWVGTHSSRPTGYARVTKRLTRELTATGAKVYVFGIQGTGDASTHAPGDVVGELDAAAAEAADAAAVAQDRRGFWFAGLPGFVDAVQADVVVLFNDPVVVAGYLAALGPVPKARVYVYLDLVYDSPSETHWATLAHPAVRGIMVMADVWRRELERWPFEPKRVAVVPHAVEVPDVPRDEARRVLGWTAPTTTSTTVGANALVFFNANRNTHRKRLDLYAAAAARFLARNADVDAVFLAMSNQESTFDLHSVAHRELVALGVPPDRRAEALDRIRVNRAVLTDDHVALLHNAVDVAVNCAEGEGFGLTPLEAASVGTAVVVSAVGAMGETFCPRAPTAPAPAVVVPTAAEYWLDAGRDGIGGRAKLVDVEALTKAFESLVDDGVRDAIASRGKRLVRAMPNWNDIARKVLDFVASEK